MRPENSKNRPNAKYAHAYANELEDRRAGKSRVRIADRRDRSTCRHVPLSLPGPIRMESADNAGDSAENECQRNEKTDLNVGQCGKSWLEDLRQEKYGAEVRAHEKEAGRGCRQDAAIQ